jgi:hypothetical protein
MLVLAESSYFFEESFGDVRRQQQQQQHQQQPDRWSSFSSVGHVAVMLSSAVLIYIESGCAALNRCDRFNDDNLVCMSSRLIHSVPSSADTALSCGSNGSCIEVMRSTMPTCPEAQYRQLHMINKRFKFERLFIQYSQAHANEWQFVVHICTTILSSCNYKFLNGYVVEGELGSSRPAHAQ